MLEDIALLRKAVREWKDRPALPRGKRNITLLPQIVDTMLGTGLRIGECLALREADLDLEALIPARPALSRAPVRPRRNPVSFR
ncbi:hypothetical protein [Isoptericola sp. NPDC057653]|uniref:hypothetical protein n=1 Tax=Isoptericola sp. NPDC057653 TaxID=3346195 RepID=UPI00368FF390